MKLALPVTYTWLTGFYAFFHVWLNFLAELLRFGDRVFYKAWWNATDFEGYWRTWNMPVHCWIVRHAYFPIQRHLTRSKTMTGVLCFTISAALHEVLPRSMSMDALRICPSPRSSPRPRPRPQPSLPTFVSPGGCRLPASLVLDAARVRWHDVAGADAAALLLAQAQDARHHLRAGR